MTDLVNKTLAKFAADLEGIFDRKLVDILLYGSCTLGDFEPHRGDLDFVVALEGDLSDSETEAIFLLNDGYRSRGCPNLEYQLEGTYYPRNALADIHANFVGCYIGTGRNGWKKTQSFCNNYFDLIQMNVNAINYKNSRINIYLPARDEIETYARCGCLEHFGFLQDKRFPSHVAVQFAARTMFYLKTGRIGSKKESCKAYSVMHPERAYLKECGNIRAPYDISVIETRWPDHRKCAEMALSELIGLIDGHSVEPSLPR